MHCRYAHELIHAHVQCAVSGCSITKDNMCQASLQVSCHVMSCHAVHCVRTDVSCGSAMHDISTPKLPAFASRMITEFAGTTGQDASV